MDWGVEDIKSQWGLILSNSQFSVGNGRNTCFRIDPWYDGTPLKEKYSPLYNIAVKKDAPVVECWCSSGHKAIGKQTSPEIRMTGK